MHTHVYMYIYIYIYTYLFIQFLRSLSWTPAVSLSLSLSWAGRAWGVETPPPILDLARERPASERDQDGVGWKEVHTARF